MGELAGHLVGEPVRETGEEAAAAGEHDVAEQHLAEVVVAVTDRGHDQRRDRLGQVRVRGLGDMDASVSAAFRGEEEGAVRTTSCEECAKNCSPTAKRSTPEK